MEVEVRVGWNFGFESFVFFFDDFQLDFFLQTDLIFFIWVMLFILFCNIFEENSWYTEIIAWSTGKEDLASCVSWFLLIFGKIFGFLFWVFILLLRDGKIISLSKGLLLKFRAFLLLQRELHFFFTKFLWRIDLLWGWGCWLILLEIEKWSGSGLFVLKLCGSSLLFILRLWWIG